MFTKESYDERVAFLTHYGNTVAFIMRMVILPVVLLLSMVL